MTLDLPNGSSYHTVEPGFGVLSLDFVHDRDAEGFPGGSDCKESVRNAGDLGSIPGLGRSPGGGHGNPLQCSCLENPLDRGAWRAAVHGVAGSDRTESWRSDLGQFMSLS